MIKNVTLNPEDKHEAYLLSNGNLTATVEMNTAGIRATYGKRSGKWYWEVKLASGGSYFSIGIATKTLPLDSSMAGSPSFYPLYRGYRTADGQLDPSRTVYGEASTTGDVVGVALDLDNYTLGYYKNGVNMGIAFTDLQGMGEVYPYLRTNGSGKYMFTANFGSSTFLHNIPEGYLPYHEYPQNKILLSLENNEVRSVDSNESTIVQIPNKTEQSFIDYGLNQSDLTEIDFSSNFTKKNYINNQATTLGDGKVFEQALDVDKIIKSVKIT